MEADHEAQVCVDPLDVALVQLADRQVAADCDDHAYQIRERPRTMAAWCHLIRTTGTHYKGTLTS